MNVHVLIYFTNGLGSSPKIKWSSKNQESENVALCTEKTSKSIVIIRMILVRELVRSQCKNIGNYFAGNGHWHTCAKTCEGAMVHNKIASKRCILRAWLAFTAAICGCVDVSDSYNCSQHANTLRERRRPALLCAV